MLVRYRDSGHRERSKRAVVWLQCYRQPLSVVWTDDGSGRAQGQYLFLLGVHGAVLPARSLEDVGVEEASSDTSQARSSPVHLSQEQNVRVMSNVLLGFLIMISHDFWSPAFEDKIIEGQYNRTGLKENQIFSFDKRVKLS